MITCPSCGTANDPQAQTCINCGTVLPTELSRTDPSGAQPTPSTSPVPAAPFIPPPAPTFGGAYATPYAYAARPPKDRSIALILEILPALFGLFGFGWIYSGRTSTGIAWLIGVLIWDVIAIVISALTAGFGCICTVPITTWHSSRYPPASSTATPASILSCSANRAELLVILEVEPMATHAEATGSFALPYDSTLAWCLRALEINGVRIASVDRAAGVIQASKGMSLLSWGERITVSVRSLDTWQCSITVVSESAMPLQFVNWGVHQGNLDHFFRTLNAMYQTWQQSQRSGR